ncbi:hypothetical protein ABEF91_008272 [Exophiala dermatitidis]
MNSPLFLPGERYNDILEAIGDLDARPAREMTVIVTGVFSKERPVESSQKFSFNKDISKTVLQSIIEIQRLTNKVIKIAQNYQTVDGKSERLKQVDKYLGSIILLNQLLAQQALKVYHVLREIQETRGRIDQKELADMRPEPRESVRTGGKRKASSAFPTSGFIEITTRDFDMLQDKHDSHSYLMQHAATWRKEILNAVNDGASTDAIAVLFSAESAAAVLGRRGIAETGERRDKIRRQAIECYGAHLEDDEPDGKDTWLWCAVTKRYWPRELVKTAHIIPADTAEGTIEYAFGEIDDRAMLNSMRNFIMFHTRIAEAFDRGQISIVPSSSLSEQDSNRPISLRLFFIDRQLVLGHQQAFRALDRQPVYWSDLAADPVLEFQNDNRPGQRNLFWHLLTSLTKAKKAGYVGFTDALNELEAKEVWAKPQPWIQKSALESMADLFMMPQIYRQDAIMDDDPKLQQIKRDIASLASFRLSSPRLQPHFEWEEEEEEDHEQGGLEGLAHPNFAPEEYFSPQALLPLSPGTPGCAATPIPDQMAR